MHSLHTGKRSPRLGTDRPESSSLGVWWAASWAPTSSTPGCRGDHSILGCADESMTRSGEGIIYLYSAILRALLDTPVIPAAPHSLQCRRNIRNLK